MPDTFLLGIDGGQTGTTCLIATGDGTIIGRGTGGHLLHLAQRDGPAAMRAAFAQSVGEAWRMAGLAPQPCAAAYLGLTGIETGTREAGQAIDIARAFMQADQILAGNDSTNALAGALLGKPGVVVIAGTGSTALGRNEAGDEAFTGGLGWLLGDEGSAFDIGRRGLIAALRAGDGRSPATRLQTLFQEHFGVAHYFDIKRIIFGSPQDARRFADLAPIVVAAAAEGDAVARSIVRDAGRELATAAAAVIRRLRFTSTSILVSYLGGVFRAGPLVMSPFRRRLRQLERRSRIVAPELPASCGSLLLALRAAGLLTDASAQRLQASARQRGWGDIE